MKQAPRWTTLRRVCPSRRKAMSGNAHRRQRRRPLGPTLAIARRRRGIDPHRYQYPPMPSPQQSNRPQRRTPRFQRRATSLPTVSQKKTTSGLKHAPQKGASLFRRGNRRVGIGNHLVNARRCRATPAAVSRTRATHLFFAAHAFLHHKANRQAYAYNQDRQHNSCCHIHNHNGLVSTGRVFAPYFHSPGTLPLFVVFLLLIEKCFPRVTYLTFFGVEGLSVNEIVKK